MKYENWKFYFREAALISEITQWIMETIVSIVMLIGMVVAFGYLTYKFRKAT